jgi:hypothetical protein
MLNANIMNFSPIAVDNPRVVDYCRIATILAKLRYT